MTKEPEKTFMESWADEIDAEDERMRRDEPEKFYHSRQSTVRRLQDKGFADLLIEQLYGVQIPPEDRRPENDDGKSEPKREEPFAPRRVSDELKSLNITGYLMPWNIKTDQPVFLAMPMTADQFIPLFSTIEKLEECCSHVIRGIAYKVKRIDDGPEMLESLPYWFQPGVRLRIIVDPWRTEAGTVRFVEVFREDDAARNTQADPSA